MINNYLINPKSIAVIGASNSLEKPGGGLVKNLISEGFMGEIYPVNPKENEIQGLKAYNALNELPTCDMGILAIAAQHCVETVKYLALKKNTKAFIIISAGFSEMGAEGQALEKELKTLAIDNDLAIIGPNCIGVTNINYKAIFVSPPPAIAEDGVDFVSASGALAVFLFETAAMHGLKFGDVYTVGNSVSIGVEEVLAHWDYNYSPRQSSPVKLVYVEQIRKPDLFFKHIHSLREKGCQVIVSKPGDSDAGARAALSHTGALAGDTEAIDMLIRKAGAIRCYSREELIYAASILSMPPLKGNRIAIITHAGGPAVMTTDCLQGNGFDVPELDEQTQETLLHLLHPGSSAANPVDMLATANREQLVQTIEICSQLSYIDGIIVIYGKTGMEDLDLTYSHLSESIKSLEIPVYTVMPSVNSAKSEISNFIKSGLPGFFDEVVLAKTLGKIKNAPPIFSNELYIPTVDNDINTPTEAKALNEEETYERLKWAGIPHSHTEFIYCSEDLSLCDNLNYPVAAKVLGILHKTEVNGVVLNINNKEELKHAFDKLSDIPGSKGMLVQEMLKSTELYLGAKMHDNLGYSVHVGVGGIFVELIKDVESQLAPLNKDEAIHILKKLKSQQLFNGFRNMKPVSISSFAMLVSNFSKIFLQYPDIREIDLNPLMAIGETIVAVDARIIT